MPSSNGTCASKPSSCARARHVGSAVADIAGAVLLVVLRLDVEAEAIRDDARDLRDGRRRARAEIEGMSRSAVGLQREQNPSHDVGDVHEVTRLIPVLEHDRRRAR